MTYLDIVNKVLTRLRENTVASVTATTYSALIGEFVNDAKTIIEDSWDWSALRTAVPVATVASDNTYVLTGTGNRSEFKQVTNTTSKCNMHYKPRAWFRTMQMQSGLAEGAPVYYTFDGVDASGDTQIQVYPTPDGVYNLEFHAIKRTVGLSLGSDTVAIPTTPIIQLATAFAARERGETGGMSAQELFNIADKSLADAIAMDAHKHPEELVYEAV